MITALYHWAPAQRWAQINREGLRPFSKNTVASGTLHYLCSSPDPAEAWLLSGAVEWCAEIEQWDLWRIRLAPGDQVHVRPFFGNQIEEVKIVNAIPADRLWYVGRRDVTCVPTDQLAAGEL